MTSARTVSRLSRILALIPYVLESGPAPVDEIIDRFGYSRDQLARDLNTVLVCGLPGYGPGDLMEAVIDDDQVGIDAADYFTRAPRLTPAESLGLLAAGLAAIGMGEPSPALESAVRKLSEAAAPEASGAVTVDLLDETDNVATLREAAAGGRVVRITYRSVGKEETTMRDVAPWHVFATLGRWYVTGHCRLVDGERTFRVDRIKELGVLEDRFERPASPPEPGVGYTASDDDVVCVIDLLPRALWVLEYYPVRVISESSAGARIRFSAPDPEIAARLLLRLGETARLVEGPEVSERVRSLGRSLLDRYR